MLCHEDTDHGLEQRNSLQEEVLIMCLEEVPIRCLVRDIEVASKLQESRMPFSVGPRWYCFAIGFTLLWGHILDSYKL